MRVFLIGYMGAGKSTLGRKLAQKLDFDFVDLDHYIEEKNGCSIAQFFQKYGEKMFRKEETAQLLELCQKENTIIAVGGGTPCFGNNMKLMNAHGKTIFINPPLDFLLRRLKNRTAKRPLLLNKTEEELHTFITKNYEQRLPFYLQAQHQLQAENLIVEDFLPFF